jgi:hypothetical protein
MNVARTRTARSIFVMGFMDRLLFDNWAMVRENRQIPTSL